MSLTDQIYCSQTLTSSFHSRRVSRVSPIPLSTSPTNPDFAFSAATASYMPFNWSYKVRTQVKKNTYKRNIHTFLHLDLHESAFFSTPFSRKRLSTETTCWKTGSLNVKREVISSLLSKRSCINAASSSVDQ